MKKAQMKSNKRQSKTIEMTIQGSTKMRKVESSANLVRSQSARLATSLITRKDYILVQNHSYSHRKNSIKARKVSTYKLPLNSNKKSKPNQNPIKTQ